PDLGRHAAFRSRSAAYRVCPLRGRLRAAADRKQAAAKANSMTGSQPVHDIRFLFDPKSPARDGVKLSTDVFLPREGGPFPAGLCARFDIRRLHEQTSFNAVGLEIDPRRETVAEQERQHVAPPPALLLRNEDLEAVVEIEQPGHARP